jgi:maltose alpha-D-glucosyltransferase/alpha-amylase
MDTPWWHDAVFYELSVRTFQDGNGDGLGDFRGLTSRLEYLAELGVQALWLLPCFPSPLRDDGYDVSDFRAIDPALGTLADFEAFVEAAHARGIRVLLDLVLNHTSDRHPWFQAARRGPGDPHHDWYVWSDDPGRFAGVRIIFQDFEPSNWTWDPQAQRFYWHRFYREQPDLNYANPAVQEAMLEVAAFWLERGVDGFRLDAVPYLFEEEGTICENLPGTHAFLRRLRACVAARWPEAVLLGEINQPPEQLLPYMQDELHMAFQFPWMPRLFLGLARQSAAPIREILERTPALPAGARWATFLRNHDELTLEMVTPGEREALWQAYAPDPRMRLNLGIRRRLASLVGGDRRKQALLFGLLLALPGCPVLYYGDEIGMGDDLALPDRMGLRTAMPWGDGPNRGFSTCAPGQLRVPVLPGPTVASARAESGSIWHDLRRFLALRRDIPALRTGDLHVLGDGDGAVLNLVRRAPGSDAIACFNLAASARPAPPPPPGLPDWHVWLDGHRADWPHGLEPFQVLWASRTGTPTMA